MFQKTLPRHREHVSTKKYLEKLAKLRNDNFDQWDVRKGQIKPDDLIQRVEQIKTDDSLMQFTEWQCF